MCFKRERGLIVEVHLGNLGSDLGTLRGLVEMLR